ncbi:MAG: AMP-binding protein, partial [Geminicoccaceae bacterium]|nr:AMP-binding protein [Geminicoccaceae bacterium]
GVELRLGPAEGAEPGHGEILAKGPNVFSGYWQNPEATAEVFTEDGFFKTGDLGWVDDDGYLHIAGRSKELIVLSGGKNVFPDEVEAVYGESGLVKEMAVLEHDDRLVGLFVPTSDLLQDAEPGDLGKRIRGEVDRLSPKLPSHARIGDFAVTARSLPRTQIGKLKRHELPPLFEDAKRGAVEDDQEVELSEDDQELLDTPPAGEVWAWLNERFEGRRLTMDSSPQLDLGLDSFDWMSLTMELEERFGVGLEEEALARVQTLRDLLVEVIDAGGGERAEPGGLSEEQARWLEPQGPLLTALGRVLFELNRLVMRTVFRLRAEGRDRLPDAGPYLIAPNHASYLDPFVLAAALSWSDLQKIYWAGWTGVLFRGPLTRLFSRITHVVPVDPKRGLTSTLALGRGVLERDLVLVWFPEGERARKGELQRFLPGAGWLIDKTGADVVPTWIGGTFQALPPGAWWPRPVRLSVRFGRPLAADELRRDANDSERHAAMAKRMRSAVEELGDS